MPRRDDPVVFLSASVPAPERAAKYSSTADVIAIQSAVAALTRVVLGQRRLVFGGHPSITPMILVAARDRGVDYRNWVTLYQSDIYEDDFPEQNAEFQNVVVTPGIPGNDIASQRLMREQMFAENQVESAVFIGGMEGVEAEYEMLKSRPTPPKFLPIATTGGAASQIFRSGEFDPRLGSALTYTTLFRDLLALNSSPGAQFEH